MIKNYYIGTKSNYYSTYLEFADLISHLEKLHIRISL